MVTGGDSSTSTRAYPGARRRRRAVLPATVVASNFGAFTITGASVGPALLMVQSSATDPGVQNSNSVTAAPGQTVRLLCDDPLARIDVPHFVSTQGYRMAASGVEGEALVFEVTL